MNQADECSAQAIGLPPAQFASAFPFHLATDGKLKLRQVGSTLRRVCPDLQSGVELDQVFRMVQPEGRITREWVLQNSRSFFLLEHLGCKLQLRGEFITLPGGETLVFLGSPWFADASEIAARGLGFEDFATHDAVVDMLQVLQASKMALGDAKKLAAKLTAQRAELRTINDRLHRQEAEARKLALIAARTDNAVVLTDAGGLIEWVNEGFVRLTGYTLEESRGQKPGSLLQGPETDPATVAFMREQLLKGEGFRVEIVNYARTGRKYWLAIEVQPIRDEQGRITNFMALESDITARKQAQEDLVKARQAAESANLAKSEFLAVISHELRTPLTSIRGFLQTILSDDEMPGQVRKEFLGIAHEQALRLSRLVDELLDLSSLESGRTQFHDEPVDLRQIAQRCLAEISPIAAKKSQRLESALADALREFHGDAVRLKSVFTNLLMNAVKYTPPGGTIRLELQGNAHEMLISVSDTGPGIPAEEHQLIFEKFHRIYQRDESVHGTGLGLPIVKSIVEHYRGRVWVENNIGGGACFRVSLPAAKTQV